MSEKVVQKRIDGVPIAQDRELVIGVNGERMSLDGSPVSQHNFEEAAKILKEHIEKATEMPIELVVAMTEKNIDKAKIAAKASPTGYIKFEFVPNEQDTAFTINATINTVSGIAMILAYNRLVEAVEDEF